MCKCNQLTQHHSHPNIIESFYNLFILFHFYVLYLHCWKIFAESYALESICKNLKFSGFGVVIVYKNLVSISITVKFCKKKNSKNRKPWFLIKLLKSIKFDKSFMVVLLFPTITWKFGYIPTFADVKSKHDMG